MRTYFWLVIALCACGKGEKAKPTASAGSGSGSGSATAAVKVIENGSLPVKIAPPKNGKRVLSGQNDIAGKTEMYPLDANGRTLVEVTGPKGTVVEVQGFSVTLEADKPAYISLDYAGQVLHARLTEFAVAFPVTATPPGGPPSRATLDLEFKERNTVLSGVAKGPVAFAGDDAAKQRTDSLAVVSFMQGGYYHDTVKGLEKPRPYDVDFVAIKTPTKREKTCPALVSKSGKKMVFKVAAHDELYVVYDRRTGKELGRKQFTTKIPECTSQEYGVAGEYSRIDVTDPKLVDAFLMPFITAGGAEVDPPAPKASAGAAIPKDTGPEAVADPGTGFPTQSNIVARLKREGFEVSSPQSNSVYWPPHTKASGTKSDPEYMSIDVELYDFSGADKQDDATAIHIDDKRAIWATASKPALIKALAPKLAGFRGKTGAELFAWMKSVGHASEEEIPNEPGVDPGSLIELRETGAGKGQVFFKVLYWGHMDKTTMVRAGDRVLLVDGLEDLKLQREIANKLAK